MNVKNFITCSQCMREITPTLENRFVTWTAPYENTESMVSNYHCEQCCYSFSIYSITKTKLAEIQGDKTMKGLYSIEEELLEQHEMEDK